MNEYSISIDELIEKLSLQTVHMPDDHPVILKSEVNRPGLPLAGYFELFDPGRIEILGLVETNYLKTLDDETRREKIFDFVSKKPVCIIFARGIDPDEAFVDSAKEYGVCILKSDLSTSNLYATVVGELQVALAPRITMHGVLVEIYGEGVLILGDSGIGKSETAIELVKRGHRLIADDAVEIKKVSNKTLVGAAPEIIKHYIELRGIGIVDVRRIFGMGSIKDTEKLDLIIKFELWEEGKTYERMGLEDEYEDIMGIKVPSITVPVRPGRNLAIILEIAAMNNRQKKMGYNTAKELEEKIMRQGDD